MNISTEGVIKLATPDVGINIKSYGVDHVIKALEGNDKLLILSSFTALNGSASLIPALANQHENHLFVLFSIRSDDKIIRNYIKDFGLPSNMLIFKVYNPINKINGVKVINYDKLYMEEYRPTGCGVIIANKKTIPCVSSTNYVEGARLRTEALFNYAEKRFKNRFVGVRFGYAFDHPIFREFMINWFVQQFANVNFEELGIKYVSLVAGSGLMSHLLNQALIRLGVNVNMILVKVGKNPTMKISNAVYISSNMEYLDSFNFDYLPDDVRESLADSGLTRADYDGKVFIPFYKGKTKDANWTNTMFVIIRNGY